MMPACEPAELDKIGAREIAMPRGIFVEHAYRDPVDGKVHRALVMGDVGNGLDMLARVHSSCLTGDVFGSLRCDCGEQLDMALDAVAGEGRGIIVYLDQEGRGIGLMQKLRAYELQDRGADTVDANLLLGHKADERDYRVAAEIFSDLGVRQVRLMTNNPDKIDAVVRHGIDVSARIALLPAPRPENLAYLLTKRNRTGHILPELA